LTGSHKRPGKDNNELLLNQDEIRNDSCAPRYGGHDWIETYGNQTRTRVGVACTKCKTTRTEDRTKDTHPVTGDYPLA
jgi:hypothetical protein